MITIDKAALEAKIEKCLGETSRAAREKYSSDDADRTAALFLDTQMMLSLYLEDVEMQAKVSKNEIERVEAESYFEHKVAATGKATENYLTSMVAKDKAVVDAKNNCARLETEFKKWMYILNALRDGLTYFRNASKNKIWEG
jgi:hypothetical protein